MRLCASDPLCAEHHPIKDGLTLHGAACHACLFLPETSCERGNKYLDRSVLVSTVESEDLAFFADFAEAVPEATITAQTDEAASRRAGGVGPERDRRTRGLLRRAVPGVRAVVGRAEAADARSRLRAPGRQAGGSVLRPSWRGPTGRSPPCCPRGATRGAEFEKQGWTVVDATDLANQETELRVAAGGVTPMPTVAIAASSSTPSHGIPRAQQRKVREFTEKFKADPKSAAINYERLHGSQGRPSVRTVRIDQKYRAVVLHPERGRRVRPAVGGQPRRSDGLGRKRRSSRSTPGPGPCRSSASRGRSGRARRAVVRTSGLLDGSATTCCCRSACPRSSFPPSGPSRSSEEL